MLVENYWGANNDYGIFVATAHASSYYAIGSEHPSWVSSIFGFASDSHRIGIVLQVAKFYTVVIAKKSKKKWRFRL